MLIPAAGQELDTSFLGEIKGTELSSSGFLEVNPKTLETSLKGVFAGGDATGGAGTILDAILSGHRAAVSILRYLSGDKDFSSDYSMDYSMNYPMGIKSSPRGVEFSTQFASPPVKERFEGRVLSRDERRSSFKEVKAGLSEFEAVEEASRCLRCGFCEECLECVGVCEKKQLIIEEAKKGKSSRKRTGLLQVPVEIHRKLISVGGELVSALSGRRISVFVARVNEVLCRGCGLCEEACQYRAIQVFYRGNRTFTAKVNEDACRGCGSCVSVCPTGAIDQYYFSTGWREHVASEILRSTSDQSSDNSHDIIFACRWLNALDKLSERQRKRVVQVMCLGSVGMGDIMKAFENGARSVTLLGCGDENCRYGSGFSIAKDNAGRVSAILKILGFDKGRLLLIDNPDKLDF